MSHIYHIGIWQFDIPPSLVHVSAVIDVFPAPQFTLYDLPQSHFIRMEEFSVRGADCSSDRDKGPRPLQPTPRFYFPPIPSARPDSPYPVDGDSTITSVSDIPAVNDPSWNFTHDPACPMSFMDLLGSPLVIYDHPANVDDVHLPQPPIELPAFPDQNLSVPKDVTAMSGQQVVVADTLCKRGINPLENVSVSLPMVPTEGRPEVPSEVGSVVLHEVAMGMGEASAPHTSVPDTHLSRPPAGARDPPQALSNASWKIRNPGQPVIPPHGSEKLDATQRTARKVASEQRRVKQQAVSDAVAELLEEQEMRINEIAKAHSILLEKVRLLTNGETHYRNKREESLANALVCIKAHQVNADRPHSQKFQLKELQEMVVNDQNMQNLDEDTKQKYLRELKESRNCKAIGVRSTNTAASRDVQATLKKIYGELQALHQGRFEVLVFPDNYVK
ncbi:hypothetical protein PISMIDRAFT_18388 [Pisolithus microcarpus 441]|uniref:Uncharacterized protein n=1 Tax=Pisolithus microcarpus 441 TaxID=765257 RepID=A0A0C9YYC5_9AGAM|nr:hypothetical protein PISMIDRAFT_18388 [Pisolithus microcarpus 441]